MLAPNFKASVENGPTISGHQNGHQKDYEGLELGNRGIRLITLLIMHNSLAISDINGRFRPPPLFITACSSSGFAGKPAALRMLHPARFAAGRAGSEIRKRHQEHLPRAEFQFCSIWAPLPSTERCGRLDSWHTRSDVQCSWRSGSRKDHDAQGSATRIEGGRAPYLPLLQQRRRHECCEMKGLARRRPSRTSCATRRHVADCKTRL